MPFGEKEEPTTPDKLLAEALYIANEMENCVVIARYKNKTVQTHWTNFDSITALGLIEYAKDSILSAFGSGEGINELD